MFLSVPQALNFLFSFHGLELDTEWIFSVFIEPLNEWVSEEVMSDLLTKLEGKKELALN